MVAWGIRQSGQGRLARRGAGAAAEPDERGVRLGQADGLARNPPAHAQREPAPASEKSDVAAGIGRRLEDITQDEDEIPGVPENGRRVRLDVRARNR